MDMFGKVPLIEIKVHVAPDQKKWFPVLKQKKTKTHPVGGQ